MQTEIVNQWIYEQPPGEVWKYLTQADLIELWLMPNDFKPIVGHEFSFRIKPIPSLNLDGIFNCKVLELVPFKKLIYSWKGGPGDGSITLDTICEWTLESYGSGTKLHIKQTGFNEANFAIATAMTDGWDKNIQKMIAHMNQQKLASK
ncbi:SRPBCC family protein [Pinibacter aurantiacus]|uniref:SRPBCC domain-containing protein n=1 Tax=Pinibacter aurantiacus TaxID=2851599 RepID=A0A9E2SFT9_9BACT|nr:SRPBCC domain-containing protein [Pinibacter aurantiacus]MBV4360440.1 SRPBCC domain-containing protein [Pinibacter aurantiacus]